VTRQKVSGLKRHLAVDTQGLPHAVAVIPAGVTDRNGALEAFERCKDNLKTVRNALVDGGYSGKPFSEAVEKKLGATVEVAKRTELHTFEVMPKRWVVERSFAWLEDPEGSGKTANESSTPAYRCCIWPSWPSYLEDREQPLSDPAQVQNRSRRT
jgi:transposase